MTINLEKTNYPKTDQDTIAPVSASQLFYQEMQQPKKCTLHSMNHFAGRHVIDNVTRLFQINNQYWRKLFSSEEMSEDELIGLMKRHRCYLEKLEDMEGENGGLSARAALLYMQEYPKEFGLRKSNKMQAIYGSQSSEEMQKTVAIIQEKSHRIMLTVKGKVEEGGSTRNISHTITLRRDITLRWRILDSMIHSHNKKAEDPIEQLQPSFADVTIAIKTIMEKYKAEETAWISLYYPEKDSIKWWIEDAIHLPTRAIKLIDGYS